MLKSAQILVVSAIVFTIAISPAIAGSPQTSTMPSIAPQSEAASGLHLPSAQSEAAKTLQLPAPQATASAAPTLEVNPQPAAAVSSPGADELPADRAFKQSEERAALERNFHPHMVDELYRSSPPYLGIEVQYTSKCFMGMEEHGLEVINVQPRGPAAQAGLRAKDQPPPPNVPTDGLLDLLHQRIGEAREGDLIVAVDDVRVHGRADWEEAIRKLKPGDTVYLTVIRPDSRLVHRTLKIAIKVGRTMIARPKPAAPPVGALAETGTFSY